jgi:Protein of unknown function (DUF3072)
MADRAQPAMQIYHLSRNSEVLPNIYITADQPMTAEQAATLKRLAEAAYELEAFQPNLTRAEADLRISMLTAKLKLLDGPPHTL